MIDTNYCNHCKRPHSELDQKQLTKREEEVRDLIISGITNRQIAERLFISLVSVKGHINNIYRKLNIKNRSEVSKLQQGSAS